MPGLCVRHFYLMDSDPEHPARLINAKDKRGYSFAYKMVGFSAHFGRPSLACEEGVTDYT